MSTLTLDPSETAELELYLPKNSDNAALVFLASVGASSRRTYAGALDVMARIIIPGMGYESFPWASLRFQHTQAIRARLVESYAPATAKKMLSALCGVLRECWRLQQMTAEDYQRAIDLDRKRITGETLPAGREVDDGEVGALLKVCRGNPKEPITAAGARDAAILALLWAGGLRRAEVAKLDLADFTLATGELRILHSKGGKSRTTYLANGALSAMADWLSLRGDHDGPLFHPINKGGRMARGERMGQQAIYSMLARRAEEAGVADMTPHDFRRTFAGNALESGADIAVVARMMGHASVTTTARYDRRPEAAKRAAAGKLHFPWRRSVTLGEAA